MEEVQIVNHLHKLIEDLQRLQQHSYPHALNNIAEQRRFQEFINLTMTMVNIEIKVRQSRIVLHLSSETGARASGPSVGDPPVKLDLTEVPIVRALLSDLGVGRVRNLWSATAPQRLLSHK